MEVSDDITLNFRALAGLRDPPPPAAAPAQSSPGHMFLRECNLVAQQLRHIGRFVERIRPDYIDFQGAARMSDLERGRIDAELQDSLGRARAKIDEIRAAFLRGDDGEGGGSSGGSASPAAIQGRSAQEQQHCESAIQILLQLLHRVGESVKRKRKERLAHVVRRLQVKKAGTLSSSSSSSSSSAAPVRWAAAADDDSDGGRGSSGDEAHGAGKPLLRRRRRRRAARVGGSAPDAAEMDELLQERVAMRDNHESEMDEVRQAQRRLAEIGDMMVEFTTHLALQTEVVADIQQNAEDAVDEIAQANDYLARTVDSSATFRTFMLVFFLGTSLLMLAYEWISA